MDNITHALAGVAIAESVLPEGSSPTVRRVFLLAGVVAATAPDFDLLYTGITEAPLGYLLHHRGHTHTWPGLAALGALTAAGLAFWPAARRTFATAGSRLLAVIALALISHLLMDAANSYGTHLLYPLSSAWFYGDAVFILEPWAGILLGVLAARNARGRWWRALALLLALGPVVGLAFTGLLSPYAALALLLGAAALHRLARDWPPRRRAGIALALTAALFLALGGLSRLAAGQAREALRNEGRGEIVDLVLDPNPAVPWCWSVLTVERQGDQLRSRRGSLSLLERFFPASGCPLHRLAAVDRSMPAPAPTGRLLWLAEWRSSLGELRRRDREDCRVAAWLQFVRAPYFGEGRGADLRYENPMRDNFSAIALAPAAAECPANLTDWEKPRRDLLGR